jgi:hypothetical protein
MIWWLIAVLAVPLFFLWVLLHEGSHALSALMCGYKVLGFRPWPNKGPDGQFRFGSTFINAPPNTFVNLAPYLVDTLAAAALIPSIFVVSNVWIKTVLTTLLVGPVANTVAGVQSRYRSRTDSDLSKVHWGWALIFFYLAMAYVSVLSWIVIPQMK